MGLLAEFKAFVMRGNVMDLAVGVVIGAAFGRIVTSLVNDVIMPPLGMVTGGVDFSNLKLVLKPAVTETVAATATSPASSRIITPEVAVRYGAFINTMVDFLIVALAIFLVIKAVNQLYRKPEPKTVPPAPSREEVLLAEIRDAIRAKPV